MSENESVNLSFWESLDQLIASSDVILDRTSGSIHPGFPELVNPLSHGFLAEPNAAENESINVWVGSIPERRLDGIVLTADLIERNAEILLLLGCTEEEKKSILDVFNRGAMRASLIPREGNLAWLKTRRSVRRFQNQPIPDQILKQVLEASLWAPSAHNRQPWRYAVLRSATAREHLANSLEADFRRDLQADGCPPESIEAQIARSHQRITHAPAAVLVCLDPSEGDRYPDPVRTQAERTMEIQSTAMAGCYLLLAAHAAGLAGVWICAPLFAPEAARRALDLPAEWIPQGLVLLGYPARIPEARRRKSLDEVVIFR